MIVAALPRPREAEVVLAGLPAALREALAAVAIVAFDFDGVLTDNAVWVAEDGHELVRCSRGDGLGLQRLAALGVGTAIISTERNPVVSARARKLQVRCLQGVEDKVAALDVLLGEAALPRTAAAFVGNDVNDAACLGVVGLPIVVADAHPDVASLARYRTAARGGHGAVREVCDLIAAARGAPALTPARTEP